MPIHEWTRVTAGIFHAFHLAWIAKIQETLNDGLLPGGYYALAEQIASDYVPDLLTLQAGSPADFDRRDHDGCGGVSVLVEPPKATLIDSLDDASVKAILLASRQRYVAIKHVTGNRTVARIEVVSPGNKSGRAAVKKFVDKTAAAFEQGIHVVLLDVLPPTKATPGGMHAAIWEEFNGHYTPDPLKPLTLAAYNAKSTITCYVDPLAVGETLPDLPLFLTEVEYVNLPSETTYAGAYKGVPRIWRSVIDQ
jgi:hypothetical protein